MGQPIGEVILCLHPAGGSGRSLQLDTHISFFSFAESFFLPKDWMTTRVRGMMTAELNALRVYGKLLKMQIGAGRVEQEQTVGKMEVLIRLIRNKKNGGRGEAAGERRPPTPMVVYKPRACGPTQPGRFITDAITGGHGFRIITENGSHRSQFDRDSE